MAADATAHIDTYVLDRLPPPAAWPEFDLQGVPELAARPRLNATQELVDAAVAGGHADRPALRGADATWSYAALAERVAQIAGVLVGRCGIVPGNRILVRGNNSPMTVACLLAAWKVGAVAVPTMPQLRGGELAAVMARTAPRLVLCDHALRDDIKDACQRYDQLEQRLFWGHSGPLALDTLMRGFAPRPESVDTAADDPAVILFTSGTTGAPKAAVHSHREMLAVSQCVGGGLLGARPDDVFCGTPSVAFAYGLGSLVLIPLAARAAVVLPGAQTVDALHLAIDVLGVSVCFSSPTGYRRLRELLVGARGRRSQRLRLCCAAGEPLSLGELEAWQAVTGLTLLDGLGSTEMLNAFASGPRDAVQPGAVGRAVPGYSLAVFGPDGRALPPGEVGEVAVKGPTGCRYLADPERQASYVRDGWNVTGDLGALDADGYLWYQARADSLIVSGGYKIAGPEVEAALLEHDDVAECAVIGLPDPERGQVVAAFVVLRQGLEPDTATAEMLQRFVKARIAPYKYPRRLRFLDALPRGVTGKLRRDDLAGLA
jgi:2-aminobenzoate-CoA ligase